MPTLTLQANQASLLSSLADFGLLYVKQYGPGNLRIGADKDSLQNTIGQQIQDGIVQVTADQWKQYFWKGDIWVISDQNGAVVWMLPGSQPFLNRGGQVPQLPVDQNLSTYKNG